VKPVFFGASWCAPCKKTYPHFQRVTGEAGEYVDVETGDSRALDIRAVPTIRVYDDHGDVVAEHRGGATEAQIRALVGA
jgi:thiol-disulfide isomerase/thioredoxin